MSRLGRDVVHVGDSTLAFAADKVRVGVAPDVLFDSVVHIIRECCECRKEIEKQRTERARIEHEARMHIENIRSQREVMVLFLEKTFQERRENFHHLFDRLDRALEQDNLQETRLVLDSLTDYAKASPFSGLRDAASAQEAIRDKTITWEF